MSEKNRLLEFETEYPKLYGILVRGVPVYASLRDGVNAALNGGGKAAVSGASGAGRVSIRRIIDGFFKIKRFKKAKTLVFTSSVYRRDKGRNLAAEFLIDKYRDTVVFEWPSRNEGFDFAYFGDVLKDKYCPLEWYLVRYKLYMRFHKKEYARYCAECSAKLEEIFPESADGSPEDHQRAIGYLREKMPDSYAVTIISQNIFKKLFKNYKNVDDAVDFWGSARENIIPVLSGDPQSVELQHGLISPVHPGYIYPDFVKDLDTEFFKRKLLVYGDIEKRILTEESIFSPEQIEVVGNPRIRMYKKIFGVEDGKRDLILFTSQPFEQDGKGTNYYSTVIPLLKELISAIKEKYPYYRFVIKLHPRESEQIEELYKTALGDDVSVLMPEASLYDTLMKTFVHITANSTVLYEAAMFGVPTITMQYDQFDVFEIFGPQVIAANNGEELCSLFDSLNNPTIYKHYLKYLSEMANSHTQSL